MIGQKERWRESIRCVLQILIQFFDFPTILLVWIIHFFIVSSSFSGLPLVGNYQNCVLAKDPIHSEWFFIFTCLLGGGNSNMLYFHPYLGKISNLTSIFFKRVGSTTNSFILLWLLSKKTDLGRRSLLLRYLRCHGCEYITLLIQGRNKFTFWIHPWDRIF